MTNPLHTSNNKHAKTGDSAAQHQPKSQSNDLSTKFKVDASISRLLDPGTSGSAQPNFRLQFLELTRTQRTNLAQPANYEYKLNVGELFAPRLAANANYNLPWLEATAMSRNEIALSWYHSLHKTMRYKLGAANIRPGGEGDCTSLDEFMASQFGHADGTNKRWYTRQMWQTGYQMNPVAANAILPGDQIVVPPKGKVWRHDAKSEPEGVGHAGVFVIDNGKLMVMHASSKYGTVVLSSPQEFMENRLGFKIFRPQGQGKFATTPAAAKNGAMRT